MRRAGPAAGSAPPPAPRPPWPPARGCTAHLQHDTAQLGADPCSNLTTLDQCMLRPGSPHTGGPVRVDVDPLQHIPPLHFCPCDWPLIEKSPLQGYYYKRSHGRHVQRGKADLAPDWVGPEEEPPRRHSAYRRVVKLGGLAA